MELILYNYTIKINILIMAKYEKNVYIAMLAEQCSRFEEMIEYLEDMLINREKDLSSD